jgi:starch synthase
VVLCASSPDTAEIAQEMETAVRRAQAGRSGVIWIREMVDRRTAIELYSHAAVFCCPSIYEPFGIINLEAMACETPVVASAVGGIPEVVVHGETGFLVPLTQRAGGHFQPADPAEFARGLAHGINALLADEALRRRMGQKGRRRVEERFSWRSIAETTLMLYRSVLQAGASAPHTGGA